MTTYKEILEAVLRKLKDKFPLIEQESQDIEEGFARPSFFASLDNVSNEDFMNVSSDNGMTVRITYFPKDKKKNQEELLDMMSELSMLFRQERLKINDDLDVEVEEVKLKVVNKVLHCDFDLMIYEDYEYVEDHDAMSELEIELKG